MLEGIDKIPSFIYNIDINIKKGVGFMSCSRQHFVETAKKYLGYNEDDGSYMSILNTYNNGLSKAVSRWGTRNVKMWSTAHWCSCYVSAMAMLAGCDDIVPIEISCYYHRVIAERNGIWVESDAYVPTAGDLIIYDWHDNGVGDNHGCEDHIGIVVACDGKTITTIEGNTSGHGSGEAYKGKVAYHSRPVNGRYIRGFIVPKGWKDDKPVVHKELKEIDEVIKVAKEVWDGKWGNGEDRKRRLEQSGYNYEVIQAMVNSMAKGNVWEQHKREENKTYTVKKGDTMCKIAKDNGLTLAELIFKNPQIKNPNLIYVGDIINL